LDKGEMNKNVLLQKQKLPWRKHAQTTNIDLGSWNYNVAFNIVVGMSHPQPVLPLCYFHRIN